MRISDWSSDVCSSDLHRQRIGIAPALFLAIDDTRREGDGPRRQLEQIAVEISRDRRKLVAAAVARGEEDIVENLGRQIAEAKIIGAGNRCAGRQAAFAGVERVGDALEIGDVGRPIYRSIATEAARDFPAPIIPQLAAPAKGDLPGVGFLKEVAGPRNRRSVVWGTSVAK